MQPIATDSVLRSPHFFSLTLTFIMVFLKTQYQCQTRYNLLIHSIMPLQSNIESKFSTELNWLGTKQSDGSLVKIVQYKLIYSYSATTPQRVAPFAWAQFCSKNSATYLLPAIHSCNVFKTSSFFQKHYKDWLAK